MVTTEQLRGEVEKNAKEAGCTEIELIQAMQAECARSGQEDMILTLHNLKMTYVY